MRIGNVLNSDKTISQIAMDNGLAAVVHLQENSERYVFAVSERENKE